MTNFFRINNLLLLFCTLFFSLSSSSEILNLGVAENFPSYWLEKKVFEEINKRVSNLHIVLENRPAKRSIVDVNSGRLDGDVARSPFILKHSSVALDNIIFGNESIYTIDIFYIYNKNTFRIPKSLDDLKNYKVAFRRGIILLEKKVPKSSQFIVDDYEQGLKLVDGNRIDGLLISGFAGINIKSLRDWSNLVAAETPILSLELFPIFHKSKAIYIPKIDEAIKEMKKDGTMEKIYKESRDRYKK